MNDDQMLQLLKQRYVRLASAIPMQFLHQEDSQLMSAIIGQDDFNLEEAVRDAPLIRVTNHAGNVFMATITMSVPNSR